MTQAQNVRPSETDSRASNTSSLAFEDKFDTAPVLAMQEVADAQPGHYQRVKIIRASFKYPLVRVEESVEDTPAGRIIIRHKMMVADHVVVRLRKGTDAVKFARRNKFSIRRKTIVPDVYLVTVPATVNSVPDAIKKLQSQPEVIFVQADCVVQSNMVPGNSPSFEKQWALNNVEDMDIDAPEAWDYVTGSNLVKVAVIDTGIFSSHPDLAANMETNTSEVAYNFIDDDGNGFVDDINGWDFVNDDANSQDDQGHGTIMAGIIGGVGNNGIGGEGVCWNVRLIAVKTHDDEGNSVGSSLAEGISYAVHRGVDVINLSMGNYNYDDFVKLAIEEAGSKNIVVVCSAGNDGKNNDDEAYYPSGYNLPNIISVAATDKSEVLAEMDNWASNYGLNSVDLAAPGVKIYSTTWQPGASGYGFFAGTSCAAPYVAGACALVKAANPSFTAIQIKSAILQTVDKIPALNGKVATGGRLNVFNAVKMAIEASLPPIKAESDFYSVPFNKQLIVTAWHSGPPKNGPSWFNTGPSVINNDILHQYGSPVVNLDSSPLDGQASMNPNMQGVGGFSYFSPPDFVGTATFNYLVTLGSDSSVGKVTVKVLPPTAEDDEYQTSGNQIVVDKGFGVFDNDGFSVAGNIAPTFTQPKDGILTPEIKNNLWTGRFTYVRTSNYGINAEDCFKYQVAMPTSGKKTNWATVYLTTGYVPKFNIVLEEWISPVTINEKALYVLQSYPNTRVQIDVQFSEIGRGNVKITRQPKQGKVILTDNHLEYVPNRDAKGTDKFQVRVGDFTKNRTIEIVIEPEAAPTVQSTPAT